MDLDGVVGEAVATGVGVLASVFIVSGISKVRSPVFAALAMLNFGLIRTVRAWVGRVAGAVELAIAAALLIWPVLLPALVAASALLMLFVAMITRALLVGDRFTCGCFGTHGRPISTATLARTLTLLGVSIGSVVAMARGGVVPRSPSTWVLGLCSGVLLVSLAALVVEMRRTAPFGPRFTADG